MGVYAHESGTSKTLSKHVRPGRIKVKLFQFRLTSSHLCSRFARPEAFTGVIHRHGDTAPWLQQLGNLHRVQCRAFEQLIA
jgi:hypothetical protein